MRKSGPWGLEPSSRWARSGSTHPPYGFIASNGSTSDSQSPRTQEWPKD